MLATCYVYIVYSLLFMYIEQTVLHLFIVCNRLNKHYYYYYSVIQIQTV